MKRSIQALVLALGIAGCAQIPLIIQIAGYAVSAMDVAIQAAQAFTEANVTDAATRMKVLNDIAQARAAEAAFQALVNGGAALDSKDVTEALADFEVAWSDVESILKSFGVLTASPAGRAGAGGLAGRLVLPSAESLMPRGADAAGVHARASAKMAARAQARRSMDPEDGFAGLAKL